jgi:hypothetical protein
VGYVTAGNSCRRTRTKKKIKIINQDSRQSGRNQNKYIFQAENQIRLLQRFAQLHQKMSPMKHGSTGFLYTSVQQLSRSMFTWPYSVHTKRNRSNSSFTYRFFIYLSLLYLLIASLFTYRFFIYLSLLYLPIASLFTYRFFIYLSLLYLLIASLFTYRFFICLSLLYLLIASLFTYRLLLASHVNSTTYNECS